eukprot:2523188-Prymnesium_polylepis.1
MARGLKAGGSSRSSTGTSVPLLKKTRKWWSIIGFGARLLLSSAASLSNFSPTISSWAAVPVEAVDMLSLWAQWSSRSTAPLPRLGPSILCCGCAAARRTGAWSDGTELTK